MKTLKFPRKESTNSSIPRGMVRWCWNVFQETNSSYTVVSEGIAAAVIDTESAALFSRNSLPAKVVTGIVAILEPFDTAVTGVVMRPSIFDREWAKVQSRDRRRIATDQWISVNQTGIIRQWRHRNIISFVLHGRWNFEDEGLTGFHVAVVADETGKTCSSNFSQLF